nr:AMP-binding protein [Knoellia sp. DB2414S]
MPSLAQVLARTASRVPNRVAVQFGSTSMTYAALDARVNQLARELSDRGLAKGDRLLLLSGNSDAFVVALYAGLRLGAIVVPVNPRSAPPEIDHFVTDSRARLLLFGPELVDTVRAWQESGQRAGGIPTLALGAAEGFEDVLTAAAGQSVEPIDIEVAEDDDAVIIYTSGTTGRPRAHSSTSTASCGSASTRPSASDCTRGSGCCTSRRSITPRASTCSSSAG